MGIRTIVDADRVKVLAQVIQTADTFVGQLMMSAARALYLRRQATVTSGTGLTSGDATRDRARVLGRLVARHS